MKKLLLLIAVALTVLAACHQPAADAGFVRVENGHFVRNGIPYYYVGTNFWYGAIRAHAAGGAWRL